MNRSIRTAVAVVAAVLCATSAIAADHYTVRKIQGWSSANVPHANDLNFSAQVVGRAHTDNGADHAFITRADGAGLRDFAPEFLTSEAYGVNDDGRVAGSAFVDSSDISHAFVTGPGGRKAVDLNALNGLKRHAYAYGINKSGQVVGKAEKGSGDEFQTLAYVTEAGGKRLRFLGELEPGYGSDGRAINDAGCVVGSASTRLRSQLAFIWCPGDAQLTEIAGFDPTGTLPRAINNKKQVVGRSQMGGSTHAFITMDGANQMHDLGTLPGSTQSEANGVNDAGEVVGSAYKQAPHIDPRAFVSGPNGGALRDLNSLVTMKPGVILTTATGINERGQVLVNDQRGYQYLLTPAVQP